MFLLLEDSLQVTPVYAYTSVRETLKTDNVAFFKISKVFSIAFNFLFSFIEA